MLVVVGWAFDLDGQGLTVQIQYAPNLIGTRSHLLAFEDVSLAELEAWRDRIQVL
jgi:hypothetical protein